MKRLAKSPTSKWHMAVLIPARDEEALLPRCLESVLEAKHCLGDRASVDIVVVADSCVDGTARIACDRLGTLGTTRVISAENVGLARRAAAKIALNRYVGSRSYFWLANTDADCVVPPNWLVDQLYLALKGIEAIAGTVAVDSFEEHGLEVSARFKASYVIAADGSHPHVHGANLGIRADCYMSAGGWGELRTAEDHDLWDRLAGIEARRVSTAHIQVLTSGRRVGRAPHGFAGALAAHNETAA